jgi:opacity protein-like surface antigen
MKSLLPLLLLASCVAPTDDRAIQLDLLYGQRDFSESDEWKQTDRQTDAWGIQLHATPQQGWGPEVGFIFSQDRSTDDLYVNRSVNETDTSVREFYMGARHNWMVGDTVQLFAGGGVTAVSVDTEVDLSYTENTPQDGDTAYAPYVQVGANAFLTEDMSLGVFYRRNFLDAEADIFTHDANVDGDLVMFTLGWRF